jgi:hypothetical protein
MSIHYLPVVVSLQMENLAEFPEAEDGNIIILRTSNGHINKINKRDILN